MANPPASGGGRPITRTIRTAQRGVAQKVLTSGVQVHSGPVIWTQNAPVPWSAAHCALLVQPQEAAAVASPQRVGPPSRGWKHLPPAPHIAKPLQASRYPGQVSVDPQRL